MKNTVAIVGSHPRTRGLFDFNRTDCDVWVFNEAVSNKTFPRADAVFQLHVPAIFRNPGNRNDPKHYEWLKAQTDCMVFMQDVYPDIPRSVKYPKDEVLGLLSGDPDHFLSSSVSMAIAAAVHYGYQRIEVYGVAMETNTEYQFQREGVAFWRGFAMGRGISFYFADPTYNVPIYGYEGKVSVEYERFQERIDELIPDAEALTRQYLAAEADTRKAVELFENESSMDAENALYTSVKRQCDLGEQLGLIDGAIQENRRYKGKADAMRTTAEGEFIFSRQEFESAAAKLKEEANRQSTMYVSAGTTLGHIHENIKRAAKGSHKRAQLVETYRNHLQGYFKVSNSMFIYKGAAEENFRYLAYLDKYVRAAGGEKSEAVLLGSMRSDVGA
jgi:hypothetical protein